MLSAARFFYIPRVFHALRHIALFVLVFALPIRDVERVARDTHAIIMCMGEYGVFRRVAKWGKWFLSCRAVCCWI